MWGRGLTHGGFRVKGIGCMGLRESGGVDPYNNLYIILLCTPIMVLNIHSPTPPKKQ